LRQKPFFSQTQTNQPADEQVVLGWISGQWKKLTQIKKKKKLNNIIFLKFSIVTWTKFFYTFFFRQMGCRKICDTQNRL